jgi:hypothetical protein
MCSSIRDGNLARCGFPVTHKLAKAFSVLGYIRHKV